MARKIIAEPPVYQGLRLTIPAREALEHAGNEIRFAAGGPASAEPATLDPALPPSVQRIGVTLYDVTLNAPPPGLVICLIGQGDEQHRGLRLSDEPAYPGEWRDAGIAWHERGEWVPCPRCGGALVWYEAGYVPGYRLCVRGHHAQLSNDGRTAVKQ
jgi:hypothetical protein